VPLDGVDRVESARLGSCCVYIPQMFRLRSSQRQLRPGNPVLMVGIKFARRSIVREMPSAETRRL